MVSLQVKTVLTHIIMVFILPRQIKTLVQSLPFHIPGLRGPGPTKPARDPARTHMVTRTVGTSLGVAWCAVSTTVSNGRRFQVLRPGSGSDMFQFNFHVTIMRDAECNYQPGELC